MKRLFKGSVIPVDKRDKQVIHPFAKTVIVALMWKNRLLIDSKDKSHTSCVRIAMGSIAAGLVLWCLLFTSLPAQNLPDERYTFEFQGEALQEALEQVARETSVNLVYDPQLVRDIPVYKRIREKPVAGVLEQILADTQLDYLILSSGTVVVVRSTKTESAHGTYFGKVVDGETGDPLPGATVLLTDASGGTSTNESGSFAFNEMITGTHRILFSYVGYKPVYKTVTIKPEESVREKIELPPRSLAFSPLVVSDRHPRIPVGGPRSSSTDPDSPWNPRDYRYGAIRSLSLFSGVQYGLPLTNLHLQGGRQGEHRITLDDAPVYNPHSFGQLFSAFSPYAIGRVELHKAGFSPSEGSQISGKIDMTHDVGSVSENRLTVQGDPLSLNIRGDLNISMAEDRDLRIMSAVRFNYWDIYKQQPLQNTLRQWNELDPLLTNELVDLNHNAMLYEPRQHHSDIRFHDIHLASRYKIDEFQSISSSFYIGSNRVNTDLLRQAPQLENDPEYLYARDDYRWDNAMAQLTYSHQVSPRLDMQSQLSYSSSKFQHRYLIGTSNNPEIQSFPDAGDVYEQFRVASDQQRVPTQRNNNRISHLILETAGTYHFDPSFSLESGLRFDYVFSRVNLSDLFYLPTLAEQRSNLYSSFAKGSWNIGNYWKLTAGSRLTYLSESRRFYLEPRAGIRYTRPQSEIGYWSARIAGGRYRQFVNQFEITNPGPTALVPSFTMWSHAGDLQVPEAWHLTGSYRWQPVEATTVSLEGYYKWQPTMYTVSYENLLRGAAVGRTGLQSFVRETEMNTVGAGVRLHQSIEDWRLQLMAGYDYNYSRVNLETQFGRYLPVPWNEPHRLQIRGLWRFLQDFSAVAKWKGVWGRKWGFRQPYYNYLAYETDRMYGDYSFATPEDDRLRSYYQLDLSVVYKPSFELFDLEIRASLINLLDRSNTIDWSLQPQNNDESTESYVKSRRAMPGFHPTVSIQMDF